ncbi:translation initiation factor eIF-2 beta subunit [Basidiobolus ranarum]|uniref:Translation initiation factor eIF-2 beta subunit n=1 Tax=Basidiobolus ranarum TaxID=34480 RepID=A0ABR2W111_9FUNG
MSDAEKEVQEMQEEDASLIFDTTMKKKKKKKKQVAFEDEIPDEENNQEEPEAEENNDNENGDEDPTAMFADLKKKKKKKSTKVLDEETEEAAPVEGDGEAFDFGEMKKKKKKKSKKADLDAFEADLNEENDQEDSLDIGSKTTERKGVEDAWLGSNRDYTYQELLGRVFKILQQNNPELISEKRRYTMVPPSIHREGSKKTLFANIGDICKRMRRQPEHVIQFLFSELGTSGSIDGSGSLIIKGRFQQKQIENVLRRYIVEYVTCKTCKSPDTILSKENRIFFLQCESCGSTRSVSAIKTGFMAQTTKRAVLRRAAA